VVAKNEVVDGLVKKIADIYSLSIYMKVSRSSLDLNYYASMLI
jgi:hypothetical protein